MINTVPVLKFSTEKLCGFVFCLALIYAIANHHMSNEVLVWLSVWSEVQMFCICFS